MATTSDDHNLRDIWAIFVRWRNLALVAFLAVLIPGILVTLLMPPLYEATATLLVNRPTIAPAYSVKPGQNIEPAPVLRSINREEEVKTVAETVRTRAIVDDTVRTLNLDLATLNRVRDFRRYVQAAIDWVVDNAEWLWREFKYATHMSTRPTPEEQAYLERENLLDIVDARLRVTPVPDTNVLRASFRSSDPVLAQKAVNTIVEDFVARQQDTARASREHFADELRQVGDELKAAEGALATYRGQMSSFYNATQRDLLLQSVEQISNDLAQAEAKRGQKRAAMEALRKQQWADPRFQRDISKSLMDTESELAGLDAQIGVLGKAIAERQRRLSTINVESVRLRDLERGVTSLEEAVTLRQRNYEQARVAEGMASDLRDVRVLDLAGFPLSPVRPRTLLYLGIALGAALLAAIAFPFIAHLNDTTLPVVATIPRLRKQKARLAGPATDTE
jgi:uncharacterized protein involved in exopolysaccharide biosynthesis